MDDRRFDDLAKHIGTAHRRRFLKGLLGLGGVAVGSGMRLNQTEAARRGYAGPLPPKRPEDPLPSPACDDGTGGCTADGCCICCNSDRFSFYWARFSSCYNDQSFCGNRTGQTCCEFCAGWADESCTVN